MHRITLQAHGQHLHDDYLQQAAAAGAVVERRTRLREINPAETATALPSRTSMPRYAIPELLGLDSERFKASLAQVSPVDRRASLAQQRRAMLGCSLGSKNSEGARLEGSIRWISEMFDGCVVLVADSIYRYTLAVTRNEDPVAARQAALQEGQRFIEQHRDILERNARGRCRLEFRLLSTVEASPDFHRHHDRLRVLFRDDDRFRQAVTAFAQSYLGRCGTLEGDLHRYEELASAYLLEEAALVCCLSGEGITVLVYPGAIKTFEEFVEGLHPGVPDELKQLTLVSLRLKRAGARLLSTPALSATTVSDIEPQSLALVDGRRLPQVSVAC